MRFLVLCVVLLGQETLSEEGPVNINYIVDKQLSAVDAALRAAGVHWLELGSVTVGPGLRAEGVRLGDLASLARKGPCRLWTEPGSTLEASVQAGLANLTLDVANLTLNGSSSPARVHVGRNALTFLQRTRLNDTACLQTYPYFQMTSAGDVTLHSSNPAFDNKNVTLLFVQEVLPYINNYMNQSAFHRLVDKYLNNCESTGARINNLVYNSSSIHNYRNGTGGNTASSLVASHYTLSLIFIFTYLQFIK